MCFGAPLGSISDLSTAQPSRPDCGYAFFQMHTLHSPSHAPHVVRDPRVVQLGPTAGQQVMSTGFLAWLNARGSIPCMDLLFAVADRF